MDIAQILDFLGISNASFLGMLILAGLGIIQALPNDLKPYTWLCHVIKKMLVGDIADKLDKLIADYNAFRNQVKQRQAVEARIRIIAFADGLANGTDPYPTKDAYEQALEDIDYYSSYVKFCEDNKIPFFNNKCNMSIRIIRDSYYGRSKDGTFRKEQGND
jgi:hypothetical protein